MSVDRIRYRFILMQCSLFSYQPGEGEAADSLVEVSYPDHMEGVQVHGVPYPHMGLFIQKEGHRMSESKY